MFNILSNITLRNITTAGVVLTVVIYLCTSCRNNHAEVERIIRNHLEPTKELYALALQTGEVTLPLGGINTTKANIFHNHTVVNIGVSKISVK